MKKYILFAWQSHEGLGGFEDFAGSYDTIEECIDVFKILMDNRMDFEVYHIFDNESFSIIRKGDWSEFKR